MYNLVAIVIKYMYVLYYIFQSFYDAYVSSAHWLSSMSQGMLAVVNNHQV